MTIRYTTMAKDIKKRTQKGLLVLLAVLLLGLTACGGSSQEPEESAESPAAPPAAETPAEVPAAEDTDEETTAGAPAALPEAIETTFLIEGMEESVVIRLFQEETLPFHTYHTEDMLAETVASGEADGVRFITNYGGNANPEAYVAVTFYHADAGLTSETFFDLLTGENGLLVSQELEWVEKTLPEELMFDWTLREYFFMNDQYTGAIYAGQYDGRFFHIDIHYPWEYGEGLEARAHVILEHFTWSATGRPLIP